MMTMVVMVMVREMMVDDGDDGDDTHMPTKRRKNNTERQMVLVRECCGHTSRIEDGIVSYVEEFLDSRNFQFGWVSL